MTENDYRQGAWNLDDLFVAFDAPEVELAIKRVETVVAEIEAVRPVMSDELDEQGFLDLLAKAFGSVPAFGLWPRRRA